MKFYFQKSGFHPKHLFFVKLYEKNQCWYHRDEALELVVLVAIVVAVALTVAAKVVVYS